MPDTDRAFRALARAGPGRARALVSAALGVIFPAAQPALLQDPKLDMPPYPKEADLVLESGGDIDHFECQGYRQGTFLDRLLRVGSPSPSRRGAFGFT